MKEIKTHRNREDMLLILFSAVLIAVILFLIISPRLLQIQKPSLSKEQTPHVFTSSASMGGVFFLGQFSGVQMEGDPVKNSQMNNKVRGQHILLFLLLITGLPFLLAVILETQPLRHTVTFFKNVIGHIESLPIPGGLWILSFLSVVGMRSFIEVYWGISVTFLNLTISMHALTYWVTILLLLSIILCALTGENISNITKIIISFWWITLTPPIVDFIVSGGRGFFMSYFLEDMHNIPYQYFSFGDILHVEGPATIGINVEGLLVCFVSAVVVYMKTKSKLRTALTPILVYSSIFFIGISPNFIKFFSPEGHLHVGMITIYSVLIILFSAHWVIFYGLKNIQRVPKQSSVPHGRQEYFKTIIENIRPLRILHSSALLALGLVLAANSIENNFLFRNFIPPMIFGLLGVFFGQLCADFISRVFDRDRKRIPEGGGPVQEDVPVQSLRNLCVIFLFLSLGLSRLANYLVFFLVLQFIAYSFIYSSVPFRLKKLPVISPVIMALCSLVVVMAGFSIVYKYSSLMFFPKNVATFILIVYACAFFLLDHIPRRFHKVKIEKDTPLSLKDVFK